VGSTDLLQQVALRIYDTTGMLPVNALRGVQGDYTFVDFIQTPFLHVIKVKPHQTSTKSFMNDKLAIDIKLVAELETSEQVVIDVHRGFVSIQIPRAASDRNKTIYTSNEVPRGNGLRVVLGLDIFNEPVHLNLAGEMNTNLSYLGTPGSGKSVSMARTIVSLVKNNEPGEVKFLLIECAKNGIDLRKFDHIPHLLHPVVTDPAEALHALGYVAYQIKNGKLPFKLIICIDEVAELIRQQPDAIPLLMTLVSTGRATNVVNLLATQLTDKDTIGAGKAVFRQIHNTILGKASNKQLSYVLGNQSDLKAEALTGEGDLLLKSNDITTRFAGVFVTVADVEGLPRVERINHLPINHYTNTPAIIEDTRTLVPSGGQFEARNIPTSILAEGLWSLQRQVDEVEYRDAMRGRAYYVLPASRVKELGRNPATFKDRDQPYITGLYRELWKRGLRLCNRPK
jgi:hypothetical protein